MRGKWLFLIGLFLLSCNNDFIPPGFYDYQVERLLSGGTNKLWDQEVNSTDCQDSVKLYFQLLENDSDDSVTVSRLTPLSDCSAFDTILIGNADASSLEGAIGFTDSLIFASGDFWIINSVTSDRLTLIIEDRKTYRASE